MPPGQTIGWLSGRKGKHLIDKPQISVAKKATMKQNSGPAPTLSITRHLALSNDQISVPFQSHFPTQTFLQQTTLLFHDVLIGQSH